MDELQKEVLVLKGRVQEQRAINESRVSKQEDNMNGLRIHLKELIDNADKENDRIKTVYAELTELLKSIEKLFLSVHCDHSPMYKILGKFLCMLLVYYSRRNYISKSIQVIIFYINLEYQQRQYLLLIDYCCTIEYYNNLKSE